MLNYDILCWIHIALTLNCNSTGTSAVSLENAVEDWIYSKTGIAVEFDSADSVALLEQVFVLNQASLALLALCVYIAELAP